MISSQRKPIRSAAIVLKDNQILLMHRINNGKEYYVFPGGGVEEGETFEETAIRETQEEMSVKVETRKLLYHICYVAENKESEQYFYLAKYVAGNPQLSPGNELTDMQAGKSVYEPMWVDLDKIISLNVYPTEVRGWILEDIEDNFSQTPREVKLNYPD